MWPRAQRLQSSVSAAPAPVVQTVAAIVIVEVVAREDGQASVAAGGWRKAQMHVLQWLQGGGQEQSCRVRAEVASCGVERTPGRIQDLEYLLSARPGPGRAAGRTGAQVLATNAPGSTGSTKQWRSHR